MVDPKDMMWPGYGSSATHQYIEGEFMKPDEYEALLGDPTDYMLRFYLPRISGAMKPFERMPSLSSPAGGYRGALMIAEALSTPEIASATERLQKAGKELLQWRSRMEAFDEEIQKLGFPPFVGSLVLVRHEAAQEMRDRPLGIGFQEQVPNRLKLHGLRALVVSVEVSVLGMERRGWIIWPYCLLNQ